MYFQNQLIAPGHYPHVEEVVFSPLEPAYLRVLRIGYVLGNGIMLAGTGTLLALVPSFREWWIIVPLVAAWLLLVVLWWVADSRNFSYSAYAVREHDLLYRSGWWKQKLRVVPFGRIQHMSVNTGMLERRFGLSSLAVYTAGASQADFSIPGLSQQRAMQLKELLSTYANPAKVQGSSTTEPDHHTADKPALHSG